MKPIEATAKKAATQLIDSDEIRRAWAVLVPTGQVVEVRALEATSAESRQPAVHSGFFDNADSVVQAIGTLRSFSGVYFTPNPVDSALLARSANRLKRAARNGATSDLNIVRRKWLLIDCDAQRPAGISATDAEHNAAIDRARTIAEDLGNSGWPAAIVADSGNGGHVMFPIDLPADDGGLVERVLKSLAAQYGDDVVKIDTAVGNPSRIWKLPGTLACKGDNTPDRPHRMARTLFIPPQLEIVSIEMLEALAGPSAPKATAIKSPSPRPGSAFNVARWIADHLSASDVDGPHPYQGGRKWILNPCPMNSEHTNGAAFLIEHASGAVSGGCHHDSCQGWNWRELREKFEPGCYDCQAHTAPKTPGTPPNSCYETLTEVENARHLANAIRGTVRHNVNQGVWMHHDGRRFVPDDLGHVVRAAKLLARKTADLIVNPPGDFSEKDAIKHFVGSNKAAGIAAMLKLAQTEPGIPASAADFDTDAMLFNCLTATIDLRTGKPRKHSAADLITKLAPVEYDPAAVCPLWQRFIHRVMDGNAAMIQYLQRLSGLALTADATVQELWFFYGSGANGKSVFLDTICGLMGDYAGQAAPSLLMARAGGSEHPTEVADLEGRRLAVASETEEGAMLKVQTVKRLTGDMEVKARKMRQDFYAFKRTWKLIIVTNNPPAIRETTNAIWRRVRIVPFTVTIPPGERDPHLLAKLQLERPGILNWCLAGCLDWQRNGMQTPEEVMLATEDYQRDQDMLSVFVEERCILADDAKVRPMQLFAEYVAWSKTIGDHQPLDRNSFYARVRGLPGVLQKTARLDDSNKPAKAFVGIEIKTVESDYRRTSEALSEM